MAKILETDEKCGRCGDRLTSENAVVGVEKGKPVALQSWCRPCVTSTDGPEPYGTPMIPEDLRP